MDIDWTQTFVTTVISVLQTEFAHLFRSSEVAVFLLGSFSFSVFGLKKSSAYTGLVVRSYRSVQGLRSSRLEELP